MQNQLSTFFRLKICLFVFALISLVQSSQAQIVGFATLDTLGQAGTYGGSGGRVVVTSSFLELQELCKSDEALEIVIKGTIAGEDMVPVSSNKTIKGETCNSVISGFGFRMLDVQNVIIENLTFRDGNKDAVQVADSAHHVWVDHCTFINYGDGLVDITEGADFITVSWNIFRNHRKVSLIGAGDFFSDTARLNVTVHHNWFDDVFERCPKVRFGKVHVFNNYYSEIPSHGIKSTANAQVVAEGNYFYQVDDPIVGDIDEVLGNITSRGNVFDEITGDTVSFGMVTFKPAFYYSYELESAVSVPETVQTNAGACYDLITALEDSSETINVFPNPTTNLIRIQGMSRGSSWQLSSIDGKMLISGNRDVLTLSGLSSGTYILFIEAKGIKTTHKIIKL